MVHVSKIIMSLVAVPRPTQCTPLSRVNTSSTNLVVEKRIDDSTVFCSDSGFSFVDDNLDIVFFFFRTPTLCEDAVGFDIVQKAMQNCTGLDTDDQGGNNS